LQLRRAFLGALATVALLLVGAGPASATTLVFMPGNWVDQNGLFGAQHSLTAVNASTNVGLPGCINALNYPNGPWAGTTYCSSGGMYKSFCGCTVRFGWGGDDPYTAPSPNYMYAEEVY
jgi:hypothetical protein